MTCDGCPNLVITPYAPWCNYDGTRKPLLYVRECPKKKNQQSRKAEGDRMNAKEAMQALLDGKTLCNGNWNHYKLDSDGYIISKGDISAGNWYSTDILCMNGVVEEYPLTFEQALRAMLDGKVVMCEVFDDRKYFFSDGWFQFKYHDDDWLQDWFEERLRDAKWKVVE